jgi:hypothetical protein
LLYWAAVAVWLPAFFERAAPIVQDIYLPVRRPLAAVFRDPSLANWLALGLLLAFSAGKRLGEPLIAVPALASLGAIAAYLIQDKLWPYQACPALAFATLALGPIVLERLMAPRRGEKTAAAIAASAAMALAFAGFWLTSKADGPELEQAVASVAAHPKLLVIGSDVSIGHPLTRDVGGVWVSSSSGRWITDMASHALDQSPIDDEARARYEADLRFDRERLVADILGKKPDVILVAGSKWFDWSQKHADVAAALAAYRWRATADKVMVYVRNDSGAAGSAPQ